MKLYLDKDSCMQEFNTRLNKSTANSEMVRTKILPLLFGVVILVLIPASMYFDDKTSMELPIFMYGAIVLVISLFIVDSLLTDKKVLKKSKFIHNAKPPAYIKLLDDRIICNLPDHKTLKMSSYMVMDKDIVSIKKNDDLRDSLQLKEGVVALTITINLGDLNELTDKRAKELGLNVTLTPLGRWVTLKDINVYLKEKDSKHLIAFAEENNKYISEVQDANSPR